MTYRTRIKICGLTRSGDVRAAVDAGADALGFVFYPQSPRYISPPYTRQLLLEVPAFVTTVGLFVNATVEEIVQTVAEAPVSLLQFHGDETPQFCAEAARAVNRPFIRAARMKAEMTGDVLLQYEQDYRAASNLFSGLLLDAFVDGYGGAGKDFDWSLIPEGLAPRVVLSGGLSVQNAADAVQFVRPYAVDISSGVEQSKGIKDADKMRAFVRAVYQAHVDRN